MRIKLDENLGTDLVAALGAKGHDVEHVHQEGLSGHPDNEVWQAAQTEERFLITQDVGLADPRVFGSGPHQGLLLIRLKRPGLRAVSLRIE
jgi:predicted nuclease of predicted toxin-antitoxin system